MFLFVPVFQSPLFPKLMSNRSLDFKLKLNSHVLFKIRFPT